MNKLIWNCAAAAELLCAVHKHTAGVNKEKPAVMQDDEASHLVDRDCCSLGIRMCQLYQMYQMRIILRRLSYNDYQQILPCKMMNVRKSWIKYHFC